MRSSKAATQVFLTRQKCSMSIRHRALWQKPNLSQAALSAYSRAADEVVSQPFKRELAYTWKITRASVHLPLSPNSCTFMPDDLILFKACCCVSPFMAKAYMQRGQCALVRVEICGQASIQTCSRGAKKTSHQQRHSMNKSNKRCMSVACLLLSMQVRFSKSSQIVMIPNQHL